MNVGTCQVCGVEPVAHTMERVVASDDDRSNGPEERYKQMCESCARDAFESGEWESDDDLLE